MRDLFRAFFFKLSRDLTFRITLIIGAGLAVLMTLLYMVIDKVGLEGIHAYCTGNNLFVVSLSPTQNFGLAIPINLITFTVLEFTHGIIRNKIVAGNSKFKIYISLFLTGLVFSLSLLFTYVGLCTLISTIIGGFDPNGIGMVGLASGLLSPEFIYRYFIVAVLVYMTITSFSVFVSTLLRSVGPCIPLVIVTSLILGTIFPLVCAVTPLGQNLGGVQNYLNPLQVLGYPDSDISGMSQYLQISNEQFAATIISNVGWTSIFLGFGTLIFVKRDVK